MVETKGQGWQEQGSCEYSYPHRNRAADKVCNAPRNPTVALCHGTVSFLNHSLIKAYHPNTQTDSKMRRQTFRTSSNMASHPPEKAAQTDLPHRQGTDSSHLSDDAVPKTDPRDVSVATSRLSICHTWDIKVHVLDWGVFYLIMAFHRWAGHWTCIGRGY